MKKIVRFANFSVALVKLLFVVLTCVSAARKPYNMTMLCMIPLTGSEPKDGTVYRVGIQIALEEVNANPSILPDYHINAMFWDEKAGSSQAAALAVKFRRLLDETKRGGSDLLAPVFYGPFFSVGCAGVARVSHHLDLVQITPACITRSFTANRRIFPNLYRMKASGEMVTFPILHFIRKLGRWNRFGIVTFSTNIFDYEWGIYQYSTALKESFEVSFFDILPEMDESTVHRIKESDTRIVVLATSSAMYALKFLCFSHKLGMTGDRYAFLFHTGVWNEPASIAQVMPALPYCTRQRILEQYKSAFWCGFAMTAPDNPNYRSSLGSTVAEMEAKFENYTKGKPTGDYNARMNSYDAIMHGVLAMHEADRALQERENLSLKNYANSPKEIMLQVNESMANVEYQGLRNGHFKYSKRLEFDSDTQIVFQWTQTTDIKIIATSALKMESGLSNLSSYGFNVLNEPIWFTGENGIPPSDRPKKVELLMTIPQSYFWFSVTVASVFSAAEIGMTAKFGFRRTNSIANLACLFFNAAAVTFAIDFQAPTSPNLICYLQRAFCAIGLTLLDSFLLVTLAFKWQQFSKTLLTRVKSTPNRQNLGLNNIFQAPSHSRVQPEMMPRNDLGNTLPEHRKNLVGCMIATSFPTIIYLFIWLGVSKPTLSITTEKPWYDFGKDTLYRNTEFTCGNASGTDVLWVFGIVAFHALVLATSSVFGIKLYQQDDVAFERYLAFGLTTSLLGTVMLVAVLDEETNQRIVISSVCLFTSGVSAIPLNYKHLKSNK